MQIESRYDYAIDMNTRSTASVLLSMVNSGEFVLELGTAAGSMTSHLKNVLACRIHGIERTSAWATQASLSCEKMFISDLEQAWPEEVLESRYDAVIAADVLEHLVDPARALALIKKCLKPEGRVLISIPNAAYSGLMAALYCEQFPYAPTGILDQTHLRFFTRDSMTSLLRSSGFTCRRVEPICLPVEFSEFAPYWPYVPEAIQDAFSSRPNGLAYQFVVEAGLLEPA